MAEVLMEWQGLHIGTHPDVYVPSDDTFLLAQVVEEAVRRRGVGTRFLEVGCGTGLVALVAARAGAQATAVDVNPAAVELARHNARQNRLDLEVRQGDLLEGIQGPFDLVAFNPPYLPTKEEDHVEGPLDLAFDGGPDGNVVVLRFARQLAALARRPQEVLIVHSSLSDPEPLVAAMRALGYADDVVLRERHFYEELVVRRFLIRPMLHAT